MQTPTVRTVYTPTNNETLSLLTFKVGKQTYGLSILEVVRIIEMVTIAPLPGVPASIQGIINLQGKVVPVMDLRVRLGLPQKAYGLHTPIILTDLTTEGHMLALVVDSVEQVIEVTSKNMEDTTKIVPTELVEQMENEASYLVGVAKVDRQMILILKAKALLNVREQIQLTQVLETVEELDQ